MVLKLGCLVRGRQEDEYDIRKLFETTDLLEINIDSVFYVKEEGLLLQGNYYGELITEEERDFLKNSSLENIPGYSAGIYAWLNQPDSNDCLKLFQQVLEKDKEVTRELYQHE